MARWHLHCLCLLQYKIKSPSPEWKDHLARISVGSNLQGQKHNWRSKREDIFAQLGQFRGTVLDNAFLDDVWCDSAPHISEGEFSVVASLCSGNVNGVVSHDQSSMGNKGAGFSPRFLDFPSRCISLSTLPLRLPIHQLNRSLFSPLLCICFAFSLPVLAAQLIVADHC